MEEELERGDFGTIYKAVDVSTGDVYIAKKFHHGNWKKEVYILMNILHVSVIINQMINSYLTFRKEVYCEIREVLGEAEISADNEISTAKKLSLLRFHHHRRRDSLNTFLRTSDSRLSIFLFFASSVSRY